MERAMVDLASLATLTLRAAVLSMFRRCPRKLRFSLLANLGKTLRDTIPVLAHAPPTIDHLVGTAERSVGVAPAG